MRGLSPEYKWERDVPQESKNAERWPNTTSAWAGWSRFDIPVDRYGGVHSLLRWPSRTLGSPTCHQASQQENTYWAKYQKAYRASTLCTLWMYPSLLCRTGLATDHFRSRFSLLNDTKSGPEIVNCKKRKQRRQSKEASTNMGFLWRFRQTSFMSKDNSKAYFLSPSIIFRHLLDFIASVCVPFKLPVPTTMDCIFITSDYSCQMFHKVFQGFHIFHSVCSDPCAFQVILFVLQGFPFSQSVP